MKRTLMIPALIGLALALTLTAAFAQIKVKSKGTAHAQGDGAVLAEVLIGTITTTIKGTISVSPISVKVTVKGKQGKRNEIKDKKTGKVNGYKYEGIDGTVTISGEKYYKVLFEGKGIKLDASGAGTLAFSGTGTYIANDGQKAKKTGKWAPRSTQDYIVTPIPAKFGDFEIPKPPAGQPKK
jgi:hypothetical protein